MRRTIPRLLAIAISVTPALAAPAASSAAGPASALTIRFVPLDTMTRSAVDGNAFIDLGAVSASPTAARSRSIIVRRRVAVRLDNSTGMPASARLAVALTAETPGCTVRVDGMTVSTLPRVIAPMHRIGTAVVHEIEFTIPASVPAGAFLSDLQWLAETD